MYNLLVLGLIPGTDIQITFNAWLLIVAALPLAMLAAAKLPGESAPALAPRQPLHATQLHQRA